MTLTEAECEQSRLVFKGSDGSRRQGLNCQKVLLIIPRDLAHRSSLGYLMVRRQAANKLHPRPCEISKAILRVQSKW